MEFGDIIYFILLVFFMILGFFNDSRKKKKQQQQLEEEEAASPYSERGQGEMPPQIPHRIPSSGKPIPKDRGRPVFQSSLDQVEDYRKYDTGDDSIEFDYDAGSIDDDSELSPSPRLQSASFSAPGVPAKPDSPSVPLSRRTSDGKNRGGVHPLVADLHQGDGIEPLKKGIIYSEILQRRY